MSIELKCCDNLKLMETIEDNTVDLIYCDILYGTGKKFKDYQDLKPKRDIIEEHYIPRIKEMHRILKDTGSIYLQMDWRISHWIRCIMDDIFSYNNFKNELYYYNKVTKNNVKKKYSSSTDTILFYTKSNNYTFHPQYENKIAISTLKEYKYNNVEELVRMSRTRDYQIKGKKEIKLKNYKGKLIDNVWEIRNNKKATYDTQKPKELLEIIIKASSNEGDLVADFYLGSGTTSEVCQDLNRNFIGCDINPRAVEIGLERLK